MFLAFVLFKWNDSYLHGFIQKCNSAYFHSNIMSVHLKPYQAAEDERAKTVLVFQPEDAVFINCLHPAGSLYEQPIS